VLTKQEDKWKKESQILLQPKVIKIFRYAEINKYSDTDTDKKLRNDRE